jgi:hypothetical protein
MTRTFRRSRTPGQSSTTEWLELLAVDGPFLAAPVVKDVWPGGLPALNKDDVSALREASSVLDASPGTRDAFIRHVLTSFLGWKSNLVGAGHVPSTLTTPVPEYGTEVRPDFALLTDPDDPASAPLLLGIVVDPGVRASARPRPGTPGTGTWPASFADRLGHALRARRVPLGLVTEGTEWTLVCAPAGGATTTATWTRHTWFDEPDTLKAFAALLGRLRFFGVPEEQTLPALLAASLDRQEEITTRLSEQSQAVVEMLVATIGRLDAEHHAQHGKPLLPATVGPAEVYQGAVTVLMRVVFLLYAEERGLLRVDDDTYADAYAISTLAGQLREHASDAGEDTLERSTTAWHRMLATFRAVHRGARHDQLTLPGYGGSLFDPDRFPWLEGRPDADAGLEDADPLRIDDRTLLRALEALQWLRFAGERRRVSFRVLDVEQIGYVYEGLLDQDARHAHDWILGIAGDRKGEKDGPEVALTDLIEHLGQGAEHFATWLSGEIKAGNGNRSPAAITKALTPPTGAGGDTAWTGVLEACGGDEATARSIVPFAGLLRRDPRDLPVIYPPGSLYLTDSDLRIHTGAIYTPRVLAEEVVARTLEPLVKSPGPLDTDDESVWKVRRPEQILALKVVDIAAGSGAFLVAATRYLADRLLDARRIHEPVEAGVEVDAEQAIIDARREILDHCIYGLDINPMALEMAKLSLWLVTLDRNRPFGFLDDRLAAGDSLLGLTRIEQLLNMHPNPQTGQRINNPDQISAYAADIPGLLREATELRRSIADVELFDTSSAERKDRILRESITLTNHLTVVANALSGAGLSGGSDRAYRAVASRLGFALDESGSTADWADFEEQTRFDLADSRGNLKCPAHFPLLFPEVFSGLRPGFDAIIGNPPFLGNRHWRSAFGSNFQSWAAHMLDSPFVGKIDLSLLFLRRAWELLATDGKLGLIVTTSLREPESRKLGISWLVERGATIYAARSTMKWPTEAAGVHISIVWITKSATQVPRWLDEGRVAQISDGLTAEFDLAPPSTLEWIFAFQGVDNTRGNAFVIDAKDDRLPLLLTEAPGVWRPYLTGDDITSQIAVQPVRYCLDSEDKSLDKMRSLGPETKKYLMEVVRPERTPEQLKSYSGLYERWWQMWRPRADLRKQLRESSPYCLAMPAVSKYSMVALIPSDWVTTNKVRMIEYKGPWLHAIILSQWFEAWVWKFSGRMGMAIINLAVTSAIRTFPELSLDNDWSKNWIDAWNGSVIAASGESEGQTQFWNRYHGSSPSKEITQCRNLRVELDAQIARTNGLPMFDSAETRIDIGPRFGWDENQRISTVALLHGLNLTQKRGQKRAKKTVPATSELPLGQQSMLEEF